MSKSASLLTLVVISIFAFGCQRANISTTKNSLPPTISSTPIFEPSPTPTDQATLTETMILPTATTLASLSPTLTASPIATAIPTRTSTPRPTIPPMPIDAAYSLSLSAEQYQIIDTAFIPKTSKQFFTAYLLFDTAFDASGGTTDYEYEDDMCRINFYSWDDSQTYRWFPESSYISTYPGQSIAGFEGVTPVNCHMINWDKSGARDYLIFGAFEPFQSTGAEMEMLDMERFKSDINGNDLPEFAVLNQYCANACFNWGYVSAHFFEIQADGSIRHITADLPGEIVPYYQILHKGEPGTLLLYDLDSSSKWERVVSWWIYAWDGAAYQDVTHNYQDDIRKWGNQYLEVIRGQYGQPIEWERMDFIEILFQYEKAGLQDEAVEIIIEITDFENWPGTDFHYQCWLRIVRENAIQEAAAEKQFSLPPNVFEFGLFEYPAICEDLLHTTRVDIKRLW